MTHTHHLAVGGRRGHGELGRKRRRRERVVAAGLELLGQPAVDTEPVVADQARLSVPQRPRRPHRAAERLDDRLVAETHTERGDGRPEAADQLDRDAGLAGSARTGGDDEPVGCERFRLVDGERIVAVHDHLRAELLEQVHEVVGERVVVVEN